MIETNNSIDEISGVNFTKNFYQKAHEDQTRFWVCYRCLNVLHQQAEIPPAYEHIGPPYNANDTSRQGYSVEWANEDNMCTRWLCRPCVIYLSNNANFPRNANR